MGAMFIGQQFLQNVLGYDTLEAGAAILPAAFLMVLDRASLGQARRGPGARFTLLTGYAFCFLGFVSMLAALEGRAARTGRSALALRASSAPASGSPARPRRTRSPVRCRSNGRHGFRHGRPPARPRRRASCSRSSARCSRPGTPRPFARRSPRRRTPARSRTASSRSSRSRSPAPSSVAAQYPQYASADHRRGEVVVPVGRRLGVHGGHHRDRARRRPRVPRVPEGAGGEGAPGELPRRGSRALPTG